MNIIFGYEYFIIVISKNHYRASPGSLHKGCAIEDDDIISHLRYNTPPAEPSNKMCNVKMKNWKREMEWHLSSYQNYCYVTFGLAQCFHTITLAIIIIN